MEKSNKVEKNGKSLNRNKMKRVLAVALSILMVVSIIDYSGFQYISAQTLNGAKTITSFAKLAEDIANQQLAVDAEESEIKLPNTLNVTVNVPLEETTAETTEGITEDATAMGSDTKEVPNSVEVPSTKTTTGAAISADLEQTPPDMEQIPPDITQPFTLEGITWVIDAKKSNLAAFDSTKTGTEIFYKPVLPEEYAVADGVELPQIKVQIKDSSKWSFNETLIIDGIEITVKAEEGVFPEGAILHAKKVIDSRIQEKIEDAVKKEVKKEDTTKTVEELISFDITITDADGNELQPDTGKGEVKVSFAQLPMVKEDNISPQELKVFHMDDSLSLAEGLDTTVDQETGTLEAIAEHFSVYVMTRMATLSSDHSLIVEGGTEGTDYQWGGQILSEEGNPIHSAAALIILGSKPLTISGTSKVSMIDAEVISIPSGVKANLTLKNAYIKSKSNSSPVTVFPGGELYLTLEGDNNFYQEWGSITGINCPAIRVPQRASLTITKESTGSMTASTQFGSAVIGGRTGIGDYSDYCGNIVINGGILNLTAQAGQAVGSSSGAAIGSAVGASNCGTITINGGTIHATTGTSTAIGVGWYGFSAMSGSITITGGKVITNTASGYDGIGGHKDGKWLETLPNVTITGGTVISNQSLVRPKNGSDPLYRTTVTLDGVGSETSVNEVKVYTETGAYIYGCQDVVTDTSGKLYLWLPDNALVAFVSTNEGIYTGTILVSPDDKTEGKLTKSVGSVTFQVGSADHADVNLSKMDGLKAGEQVLIHIDPEMGYELAGLSLYEGDTVPAEPPTDTSGFTKLGANRYLVVMPEGNRKLYVNMKMITDTGDLVISKAVGCNYVYDSDVNVLTLTGSGSMTLGMKSGVASTKERIVLGNGASIALTIDNLVIKEAGGSAIDMLNTAGNCKIIMVGNSEMSSEWNNTVIHKGDGTGTLTFDGEGSLKVSGGSGGAHSGIGASGEENTTGLVFAGGMVTVDVTMYSGAAIGTGWIRGMSLYPSAGITISGGKVTGRNNDNGQGIGSKYDSGKNGSLTISGGTVLAQGGSVNPDNGGITNLRSANLVINGGSIFTQSKYKGTETFRHLQPRNGNGEPLYATEVTVGTKGNLSINARVTDLTIKTSGGVDYPYGITDMYTDGSGKLYLWLPNETVIKEVKTVNGTYMGQVTTNNITDMNRKAFGYSCIPVWGTASGIFTLSGAYFTAVKDITLDTSSLVIGTDFNLAQHVSLIPANPTNNNITWSVEEAGTAQASVTGDILKINKPGAFTIKATVTNGAAANLDYVKRFSLKFMLDAGLNAGDTVEVTYGEILSIPITVHSQASGSVVLSKKTDGSEPVASGTIVNGHASVVGTADKDFTIGDNPLYVVYAGDSSYSKESKEITVKVNRHPLSVNMEFTEKTYDGTTDIIIKSALLTDYVSGDIVSLADYASVIASAEKSDAGMQNVKLTGTFSLNGTDADRYVLTQPQNLSIEIQKAPRTMSAPVIAGKTDKSVTLSPVTPSAGDMDGQVVYGCVTENDSLRVSEWQNGTEFTGLDCGKNYYFFAKVNEGNNYKASISTGTEVTTEATILQKPTLIHVTGYTYRGSLITAELDHFDQTKMTVSGNTQTDAGTYSLTVQLMDTVKYKWADNTVTDVTLEWKILRAPAVVTAHSFVIAVGAEKPTYTAATSGLVAGDTISGILFSDGDADRNKKGVYTIIPSGGNISGGNNNYHITYQPGTLTVTLPTEALDVAIQNAEKAKTGIVIDDRNEGQIQKGTRYVTTAEMKVFNQAIQKAVKIKQDALSLSEVQAAIKELETAEATFTMAIKTGTYQSSGSGNGEGSSSGGSSDTTETVPETKPEQPETSEVSVTAVVTVAAVKGKKGKASVSISDQTLSDAIAKAKTNAESQGKAVKGILVKLNITMPKGATSLMTTLTRDSLNSFVSTGVSSLEINSSLVTVSFDKKALSVIKKKSTGKISIAIAPKTKLSTSAKKLIGSRPVYYISVGYGRGKKVSDFGGGKVIVSIPYTPGKKEAVNGLYAVYVNAKGKAISIKGSVYDVNSGCVIFTTNRLSICGIGYSTPEGKR